ncbi:MAG: glycosyltransferase family 1 protein [Solirubrobacteraceae bacterium]
MSHTAHHGTHAPSGTGSARPLTIGIDARAAAEVPAGRGRVVRELLRALAASEDGHNYRCYARTRWDEQLDARFQWREIAARDPLWHVRTARAAQRECDVFLSSNSYLTPLFTRMPVVAIVYDLVTFEPAMLPNRRSAVIERLTLGACVRRAAAVIAISQATADALAARFPAAATRTTVALLGTSPALAETVPNEPLPEPGFVLAVGTLEPRKNLPRLVAAYRELDAATQSLHPLVVVGALGWQTGETLDSLRSLDDRARMLGHVSDAALAELYRRCAVFCYPSLAEGFGLPVLEAMAAGAAVLTSNVSSLPEVGGDAVEYADPTDVASIAAGLKRLLNSPERRSELGALAIERSLQFTWARFAECTLAVLEGAAVQSVRGR